MPYNQFHGQGTPSSQGVNPFGNSPLVTGGQSVPSSMPAPSPTNPSPGTNAWSQINPGSAAGLNQTSTFGFEQLSDPTGAAASVFGGGMGAANPLQPGFGESTIMNNVGAVTGPSDLTNAINAGGLGKFDSSQLGGYWQGIQGKLSQPSHSEQVFNTFRAPDIASDPGLGGYYARAKERALEDINNASAARGTYGNTSTLNQIGDVFSNLNAEQANREADYNLQRTAEQRAWEQLHGQLGGQADQAMLGNVGAGLAATGQIDQNNLQQTIGKLNAMLSSGQLDLQRYNALVDSAIGAQNLGLNRENQFFGNVSSLSSPIASVIGGGLGNLTSSDMQLLDAILGAGIGKQTSAANESTADTEKVGGDLYAILQALASGKKAGLF